MSRHYRTYTRITSFNVGKISFIISFEIKEYELISDENGHFSLALALEKISFNEIGLEAVNIQDKTGSYAYHIPEGILLIFNGAKNNDLPKFVMLDEIAPSILNHFKVKRPVYMKKGYNLI